MSPKSFSWFRIVSWKFGGSGEGVYFFENCVNFFICENTILTIDDSVKSSLFVESESEIIMDSFFRGDVFSPRELDFITIGEYFRRTDNRMKCRSLHFVTDVMKRLTNLTFFDLELVFILDRKPLAATVDLDSRLEIFFERRLLHDIYYLPFDEARFAAKDSNINNTLGYSTTRDENLFSFRSASKSLAAEDEFLDGYIREDGIFLHEKNEYY
jgi:hypothetical protein